MSDDTETMGSARPAMDSLPDDFSDLLENSENTVHRFDPALTRGSPGLAWADARAVGSERFRPREMLGEGGMAVVHSADQVALRRTVALKALPTTRRGPSDVALLVREAQTTAKLDHPNIVPVYDLDHDVDDMPFMVMKKVVGESWRAVMHDDDLDPGDGGRSRFELNMDVLDSVCDALRFAHAQGVLHRDVKPANVMVGEYGEVYVVDWGIAVSAIPGTDPPKFPVSSPWVGSPAYMAPEMIERGVSLTVQTDIYQLGGMLYEMLVGRPPHAVRGRMAIERSIGASPPRVPPGIDEDLVAIIERAMAFAPADRFDSVGAFQRALREHLSHRVSHRLVAAADVSPFEAALTEDDDSAAREHYEELAGTLRLALEEWPANARASQMLNAATERLARYCLERGRPERAQELLRAMEEPPQALEAECALALQQREAHVRVGQESDLQHGARGRVVMVTTGGIVALLIGLVQFVRGAVPSFGELIASDLMAIVLIAVFSSRREWVAEVRLHRNVAMLVSVLVVMRLAMIYAHDALGLDATQVLTLTFPLWSMLAAAFAAMVDWRMLIPAAVYGLGFVVVVEWPGGVYPAMCAGHFAMLTSVLLVFVRPGQNAEPKSEGRS